MPTAANLLRYPQAKYAEQKQQSFWHSKILTYFPLLIAQQRYATRTTIQAVIKLILMLKEIIVAHFLTHLIYALINY